MAYRDYINSLKRRWIGRKVTLDDGEFTVVDVDYNGMLLINKPAQFTETTAINPCSVPWVQRPDAND